MTEKHKSIQDSKFENEEEKEEEEEEEEESRLGMITKQRSVPSKWTATEPLKNKRKRKRKKKAKESWVVYSCYKEKNKLILGSGIEYLQLFRLIATQWFFLN